MPYTSQREAIIAGTLNLIEAVKADDKRFVVELVNNETDIKKRLAEKEIEMVYKCRHCNGHGRIPRYSMNPADDCDCDNGKVHVTRKFKELDRFEQREYLESIEE